MEKLNYREAIEKIINDFSTMVVRSGSEVEIIRDREGGHYLVILVGWNDRSRVYGTVIHLDIKDDKIWIQQDRTDPGIARDLLEAGIPQSAIVLAFQSPELRKFTDYAIN
jgi:XisI protein